MKNKILSSLFFVLFTVMSFHALGFELPEFSTSDIPKIKYKNVSLNSLEDIEKYKNTEDLYSFSNVNLDLNSLTMNQKKTVFVELLLPAIEVVNSEINHNKEIVKKLSKKEFLTEKEYRYAKSLFKKYRVPYGKWKELDDRLLIYPTSLILTQGALESAWGTSRFFKEGNNLFGIWSTNPNEPRIPAKGSRADGFRPHLKKYTSIKESVADIVLTLSRGNPYKKLRRLIRENKSPEEIAQGLASYSEEGELYVKKVISTLKRNNFTEYDS